MNPLLFVVQGTRDYNVGESPSGSVLEVADDIGLDIKDHIAKVFNCAKDVVEYDLLLVMDKVAYFNTSTFIFLSWIVQFVKDMCTDFNTKISALVLFVCVNNCKQMFICNQLKVGLLPS